MAIIKAIFFALLVATFQGAKSKPAVIPVGEFLDVWLHPLITPLYVAPVPIDTDVLATVEITKGAVAELLDQEQIRLDQAEEIMEVVIAVAAKNNISLFTQTDIALEKAVEKKIIDTDKKVLILLAGIREEIHNESYSDTLKQTIEACTDAAVAARVIDQDTANGILNIVADEVNPDPDVIITADDVENAVGDAKHPLAIDNEVRKVALQAVDAYGEAADHGLISEDERDEVLDLIWDAAKSNKLTELSQVDIALEDAVAEDIIEDVEKVFILMNAITKGLHDGLPKDLEDAVQKVLHAALIAGIIDEDTADAIMDKIPDKVKPDFIATINAAEVADAAYEIKGE